MEVFMKKMFKIIVLIAIISIILVLSINFYIIHSTKKQIIKGNRLKDLQDIDCILILGAGIWGDRPSPMLQDRLDIGINLYNDDISSFH